MQNLSILIFLFLLLIHDLICFPPFNRMIFFIFSIFFTKFLFLSMLMLNVFLGSYPNYRPLYMSRCDTCFSYSFPLRLKAHIKSSKNFLITTMVIVLLEHRHHTTVHIKYLWAG